MYEFVDITFMKKVKKSVNVAYNLLSVNEHSLLNYICSKFNSRKETSLVFIETITNICESKFTMILIVAIFIRIICNYLYTHYIKFYRLWTLGSAVSSVTVRHFPLPPTVCAPDRFGRDCSLECSSETLAHPVTSCRGLTFCVRDPRGCSCLPGYQPPRCDNGGCPLHQTGLLSKA